MSVMNVMQIEPTMRDLRCYIRGKHCTLANLGDTQRASPVASEINEVGEHSTERRPHYWTNDIQRILARHAIGVGGIYAYERNR
jgi:hypothetical protein